MQYYSIKAFFGQRVGSFLQPSVSYNKLRHMCGVKYSIINPFRVNLAIVQQNATLDRYDTLRFRTYIDNFEHMATHSVR